MAGSLVILAAEELDTLRGSELLQMLREVLMDEADRIRSVQATLVAAGFRSAPDPDALERARRFHATEIALARSIELGREASLQKLTEFAREALRTEVTRDRLDATPADAGEPGEAGGEDQTPVRGGSQRP